MDYLLQIPSYPDQPRFDPARFIRFVDGAFDPMNSFLVQTIPTLPKAGEYTVSDDANRPDMISAAIYNNDTQYWWVILIYNNMWYSPESFNYPSIPTGTVLSYVSIDNMERLVFTLRATQLKNTSGF